MIELREAGGLTEIGEISIREASGLTEIGEVYIREASGQTLVWSAASPINVSVSPSGLFGAAASPIAVPVTTNSASVSVTGGVGPYTYQWNISDELGATWSVVNQGNATTALQTSPLPGDGESATCTVGCTVTDSRGNVGTSSAVSATATNYGKL